MSEGQETDLLTLHAILSAWQDDRINRRDAMRRARIDTLDELYEAVAAVPSIEPPCRSASPVPICRR